MNWFIRSKNHFISFLNSGVNLDVDIESVRKIRLLNISGLICVAFLVPLAVKSFMLSNYFQVAADLLLTAIFLFSFIYIRKTSGYHLPAQIAIHALMFFLIYLVYKGGIGITGPVWIFIFPMAAFFLHGMKRGMGYTLFFTVCIALLLLFNIPIPGSAEYHPVFRRMIFLSYLASALFAALYECVREDTFQKMKQLGEKFDQMSKHDPLTNLMNRRGIYDRLEYEHERAKRNCSSFCVLMGDIDFFKNINDEHGHDAGDYVLARLASSFNFRKRAQDLIARWGGEEFLFLLPDTDLSGAVLHAEEIRKNIERLRFSYRGCELKIFMSFGAAEIEPDTDTPNEGINEADKYLLMAKSKGRNMVMSKLDLEKEKS